MPSAQNKAKRQRRPKSGRKQPTLSPRFQLALDSTHDWEYWLNPRGRIIYCSPSCQRITGYDPRQFLTCPRLLRQIVHPADRRRYDQHVRTHSRQRCNSEGEWRIRHLDGTYRWIAHACQPVYDTDGTYLGTRGSNRDISERKYVEEALRQLNATLEQRVAERTAALAESESRFRTIFNTASNGMFLLEPRHRQFYLANHACLTMLGYTLEEFRALALKDLHRREDLPAIETTIAKLSHGNLSHKTELWFRRKDGRLLLAELNATPFSLNDGNFILVDIRDITRRKQLEAEVLRISETERQRLGRDLHDGLSQHLAAMSMLGDSLVNTLRHQTHAHEPAVRLAQMAREALTLTHDLSRNLYPTTLKISGLPVALQELALLVEKMFPLRCRLRIRHSSRLDENLERQLFRIAQEAAFNAAKHSQGRHIWIGLTQNHHTLTLSIRDDGRGAPVKNTKPGGLGLNIMQYRAGLIGATLRLDSRPGRGTTLTCQLQVPTHENHKKTHLHR